MLMPVTRKYNRQIIPVSHVTACSAKPDVTRQVMDALLVCNNLYLQYRKFLKHVTNLNFHDTHMWLLHPFLKNWCSLSFDFHLFLSNSVSHIDLFSSQILVSLLFVCLWPLLSLLLYAHSLIHTNHLFSSTWDFRPSPGIRQPTDIPPYLKRKYPP